MAELELYTELLTFFILTTTALSILIGAMQWNTHRIKTKTLNESSQSNEIIDNHREINQLKEMILKLSGDIQGICDRLSKMEGEWNQHNREGRRHDTD